MKKKHTHWWLVVDPKTGCPANIRPLTKQKDSRAIKRICFPGYEVIKVVQDAN